MTMAKVQKRLVTIYARKSRLKGDNSEEIERQIELLTDYADRNNMEYVVFSEEASSEEWETRKGLQKMIQELKRNIYRFPTEDSHFKEREGRSPVSKWEMNVGRR